MPDAENIDLGPEVPNFPPAEVAPALRPLAPVPQMPRFPVVDIQGDTNVRKPEPGITAIQNAPRAAFGSTYRLNIPAETFDSPSYQSRLEQEQIQIYRQARNVQQAQADVSAARRMLGILKADRERSEMTKSGVPPQEAMQKALYNNLSYFVQPSDKGFAGVMNAVRPPPAAPYMTNFAIPGTTNMVPAVISPSRTGAGVHIVPRTALPQPEFKAGVEEIAPGIKAAKLGPNHYQLLEKPQMRGSLSQVTKMQVQLWRDEIKDLRSQKKGVVESEAKPIQQQIDTLSQKIMGAATEAPKRLKWNPEKGDFE